MSKPKYRIIQQPNGLYVAQRRVWIFWVSMTHPVYYYHTAERVVEFVSERDGKKTQVVKEY